MTKSSAEMISSLSSSISTIIFRSQPYLTGIFFYMTLFTTALITDFFKLVAPSTLYVLLTIGPIGISVV